jgi:site-specific DNA-cytosine methylase
MKLESINRKSAIFFYAIFLFCIFTLNAGYTQTDPGKKPEEGKKQEDTKKPEDKMYEKAKEGWQTSDYKPYISTLKDLEKLSKEYSEFLLKRSVDEYSKGFDTLQDMQAEIVRLKEVYKNKKYLNEVWYWQEVDRKNAQDRYINRLKIEAKTKAITYFTRSINTIDEIKNNDLKNNETFIDFKSKLFRIYVSTQYDLGNMKPCIPILERYITMREENRKDIWAYKYLSSCYAVMEAMLDKSHKTNEEDVIYYKNKKNQCLLTAAELQYGTDSPEFKELQKIVQLDERTAEVINIK